MSPDPKESRELGRYLALGQVGLEMVAPIVVGLAADHYFGCGPWATVAGCVLGFVGGMIHLVLLVQQPDGEERGGRPRGGGQ